MDPICSKNGLADIMNFYKRVYPDKFEFVPSTYLLPRDKEICKAEMDRTEKIWIAKSSWDKCGERMDLIKKYEDIDFSELDEEFVIQEYICNPLLLGNRKFSIRRQFNMYGYEPMHTYVSTEGYLNVCSNEYQVPTDSNLDEKTIHITNMRVNEHNPNYIVKLEESLKSDFQGEGTNMIRYEQMFKMLAEDENVGPEKSEKLRKDIDNIFSTFVSSLYPCFLHSAERELGEVENFKDKLFLSSGIDIFVDDQLKPWIIEINWDAGLE
jgi:hypothetical protein